jgi:hypothetical protein
LTVLLPFSNSDSTQRGCLISKKQIEKLKCRCEDHTNREYVSFDSKDFGYGQRPGATEWGEQNTELSGSITGRKSFDQLSRQSIHKKNSVSRS